MFGVRKHAVGPVSVQGRDFEFTLKLRVESPAALWQAALQSIGGMDHSRAEIVDLIGPAEDPSIEDCLMALALPRQLPGCTMLNVLLAPDS